MTRAVRIANCSGFYGDRFSAAREMLAGPIDVLTGDYLAELTMLILWKARRKDESLGYATTFLRQMQDVLGTCLERGGRGRLRPQPRGWPPRLPSSPDARVAYLTGDDLAPAVRDHRPTARVHQPRHRRRWPRPNSVVTANAYLGGWASRRPGGLARHRDLRPGHRREPGHRARCLVHGWARDDWDAPVPRRAGRIECGPQATGGNHSFTGDHRPPVPGFPSPGRAEQQRHHQARRHGGSSRSAPSPPSCSTRSANPPTSTPT
jgi:hypothetical protein